MGTLHLFEEDLAFLRSHVETLLLENGRARVAVVPAFQGRVMTSAATDGGASHGFLNRELIAQGIAPADRRVGLQRHIHALGGEDRFWIGPEGGQFSYYFPPGSEFVFEHWRVPDFVDTTPWVVSEREAQRVRFRHRAQVSNWSGHAFDMDVERDIVLLEDDEWRAALELPATSSLRAVAFESRNTLTNAGTRAWREDTGLPSIWIPGMFNPGPRTRVVIPFVTGDHGPIVTDDYFGKVPADRLTLDEAAGVLFFTADGQYRSKIGMTPRRSRGVAGSWDPDRRVLTIVQYNAPQNVNRYVDSRWVMQDDPYAGDALNSYNDGPVDGGSALGPFYELETSSPALALAPGESATHVHRTLHVEGERGALDELARRVLGGTESHTSSHTGGTESHTKPPPAAGGGLVCDSVPPQ